MHLYILNIFRVHFETGDSTSTFNYPPVTSYGAWHPCSWIRGGKFVGIVMFLSSEGILMVTMGVKGVPQLAQLRKNMTWNLTIRVSWKL